MTREAKNVFATCIGLFFLALPVLCGAEQLNANAVEGNARTILPVFVSILPQTFFVERIGGERVAVDVLLQPGKNPATYAPTPSQMSRLAKSKLFFRIGVPFEDALMPRIENVVRNLGIVDTRKGIVFRKMEGGHGQHNNERGNDPHIWLSPLLVKKQAKTIFEALVDIDPSGKSEYLVNYKSFIGDLNRLDQKIRKALAPVRGGTLFVFHPAFGYFADAYGLKQMAVEIEGKAPKGKDLAVFIKKAKKAGVRVIFVQPHFDQTSARKIAAAIGGAVVSINPLARDYIVNLETMAAKVAATLK